MEISAEANRKYRVILIDDDREMLAYVKEAIEADPEIMVCETATDGTYGEGLVRKHQVDVALLDVEMPGMGGIEAARRIKSLFPQVGVIMLTSFRHDTWLKEALEAGADGFITKDTFRRDLALAIKKVAHGGQVMSTRPLRLLTENYQMPTPTPTPQFNAALAALTDTEQRVWHQVLQARTNAQIARDLGIQEASAKAHMTAIMRKFQVSSRAELLVLAGKNGALGT